MDNNKQQTGLQGFDWDGGDSGASLDDLDRLMVGITSEEQAKKEKAGSSVAFFEEGTEEEEEDDKLVGTKDAEEEEDEKEKKTGEEDKKVVPEKKKKEEASEEEEETDLYANLYAELAEGGSFELDEDEEIPEKLTSEEFFERLEAKLDQRLDSALETFFKDELDEDARAFLKFKKNGGATTDFFKTYGKVQGVSDLDITKDSAQKQVIRMKLRKDGIPDEEIDEEIEMLTDLGKLEARATAYYNTLKRSEEKEKQQLIEQQKAAKLQAEEQRRETFRLLNEVVQSGTAGTLKLGRKDKDLPNYILAPAEKGGNISQFAMDMRKVYSDPSKLAILAKLVRSDFDLKDLEVQAETKIARGAKRSLQGRKSTTEFGGGKRSLAELL